MHELPEFPLPIQYRADVIEALEALGVVPRPDVQPRVIYSHLRALLTFEIRERKLRRRELEAFLGPQPLDVYADQIGRLREKYSILRRLPRDWIEAPE